MEILYFTYPLSATLIFIMAIGLGAYLTHKFKLSWLLYLIGAATFVFSQIGHIPFNNLVVPRLGVSDWPLVFQVLFYGLSAGLWEEWFRYAAYRWVAKDARTWPKGLLMGAGHGGVEALIIGGIILITYLNMVILRSTPDLSTLVPADQLAAVQEGVEAYWSTPWYISMLGFVERAFSIPAHLTFSILVLQAFLRGQVRWVWFSVALHTLLNAVVLYVNATWGAVPAEIVLGLLTIFNLYIIFKLRSPEPEEGIPAPAETVSVSSVPEVRIDETPEDLDRTRYQQ